VWRGVVENRGGGRREGKGEERGNLSK